MRVFPVNAAVDGAVFFFLQVGDGFNIDIPGVDEVAGGFAGMEW